MTKHVKDLIGQKFGQLKVISYSHVRKGRGAFWNCLCDCGEKKIIQGSCLKRGRTRTCGTHDRMISLVGRKFNRLTVIDFSHRKDNRVYWNCLCDCGTKRKVSSGSLGVGNVKSCGCLHRDRVSVRRGVSSSWNVLPLEKVALNRLYLAYKGSAKYKGFEFNLTKEQLLSLIHKPCHYCGSLNANIHRVLKTTSTGRKSIAHRDEEYHYNGIDRVNSSIGYRIDNVVPCCKICNKMKLNYTTEDFIEHCEKIVKYIRGHND